MTAAAPRLYLIAAEPSGDRLGAALTAALRAERPEIEVIGIGGRAMAEEGVASLFDIAELSVMGLTEVVPRLPVILSRLAAARSDVLARRPDALVTIDAPSFGLRVASHVRARAPGVRTIHYVAPSVWAWRPGRARRMAAYIDHVLALLPFEPPFMTAAGMSCDFVGHPVAERAPPDPVAVAGLRAGLPEPVLLIAPGSRRGEVTRLMPVFGRILAALRARGPVSVLIPVAETVEAEVRAWAGTLDPAPRLILPAAGEAAKRAGFAAADAALVASGTVVLEVAAAGTPMVAAYRTSWLTAAIVRRIVKVDTANLVNLVAGEKAVPEFLQEYLTPEAVVPVLAELLAGGPAAARQRAAFDRVLTALGRGGDPPSLRAARSVLRVLAPPAPPR